MSAIDIIMAIPLVLFGVLVISILVSLAIAVPGLFLFFVVFFGLMIWVVMALEYFGDRW